MSLEQHTRNLSEEKPELAAAIEAEETRKIDSGKKLDSIIGGALADAEKPDEFEDFVSARSERDELKARHGTDTAGIVSKFNRYQSALAESPEIGAEFIQSDYLGSYNIETARHAADHAERSRLKSTGAVEKSGKAASPQEEAEHPWKKLDRIIEQSIEEHGDGHDGGKRTAEKAEFEAAQPAFDAARQIDPSLTWQRFFKNAAHADRELWRDPGYASRLAAASGMPVTQIQHEMVAIQRDWNNAAAIIQQMNQAGILPDLDTYVPAMAEIARHPDWAKHRTGNLQQDALTCYNFARQLHEAMQADAAMKSASAKATRNKPIASRDGLGLAIDSALSRYRD